MKWLLLGSGALAAALAVWILIGERLRPGPRSSLRGLVTVIASLVVFGAIMYMAHFAGFFSLPLLAAVFVPMGLAARWSLVVSRNARLRREASLPPPKRSRWTSLRQAAMWPLFLALVVGVAALAYAIAVLASNR
jgi:hypothetical protein